MDLSLKNFLSGDFSLTDFLYGLFFYVRAVLINFTPEDIHSPSAGVILISLIFFFLWFTADTAGAASPRERWLKDEDFRNRVRDLEIDYKDRPKELRLKTVLLAFVGYLAIFAIIALMIFLGTGLANALHETTGAGRWIYFTILIPAGFTLRLAASLLSPRGEDVGVRLYSKDAPLLFTLLSGIQEKAKGPPFQRIFISMEMNASVARHTGFLGFFGFGPVTLNLGLPLMQALTEAQLAGVVGHEYGHVAARDNALGHWIYRIRSGWLRLDGQMKGDPLWHTLRLDRFYNWFTSVFNAYSFTLSRQCEYEADTFAAKASGKKNIAAALVSVELFSKHLEKDYWNGIWKKTENTPEPAGAPYRHLGHFFKTPYDMKDNVDAVKKLETGYNSTHPALPDRLKALGEEIAPPEPLKISAAEKLLGKGLEAALAHLFDDAWRKNNERKWKKRYKEYQSALHAVSKMKSVKISTLSRDELVRLIFSADTLQDNESVITACEELLRREPDNMSAKTHLLGCRLLHASDESALLKLDDLVREHPEHTPAACRFAIRHLEKQGRTEEAKVYQFRLDEWNYQNEAAAEERRNIFATDVFLPHNITPEYVKKLTAFLKKYPEIGSAWLVRKEVSYFKKNLLFVVGLKPRLCLSTRRRSAKNITAALEKSGFPPVFRFFWTDEVRSLKSRLKRVPNSKIY